MANKWQKFKDWFLGNQPDGRVSVGGQAVMEGVMMQGPNITAIAVRQPNGKIVYKTRKTAKPGKKYPFLKWPLIRGVVSFVMSLVVGMKILTQSAEMAGEQAEEPSKFEKKVAAMLHMKVDDVMIMFAVILAVILSIGLFFALPTAIESFLKRFISDRFTLNLLGGLVRITVFLLYVFLCSRLKEIRRVFQYHGAEHKSIFCFEAGEELTVENARKFGRLHPRCGTSFLMIVMVISILIFMIFGSDSSNVFARLGSRLALLPLVAGVSYEILKGLAYAEDKPIVKALKWPGLMVQKITTAEPDDKMLEVALVSLKVALEMRDPLPAEYYEKPDEAKADASDAAAIDAHGEADAAADKADAIGA
ncbi:MAG: DUF1385 domain-containing protein [Clostridia bacterium]|nr:DUF1385 domain-containing protein [Clostridia bacterium]